MHEGKSMFARLSTSKRGYPKPEMLLQDFFESGSAATKALGGWHKRYRQSVPRHAQPAIMVFAVYLPPAGPIRANTALPGVYTGLSL